MEGYVVDILNVVRYLRRTLYHPTLDGIVDKGDADVDNLISYVELIGENQFYTLLAKINKTILLAFIVCTTKTFKLSCRLHCSLHKNKIYRTLKLKIHIL